MEYGLRGWACLDKDGEITCLNPCFNGIWSARAKDYLYVLTYDSLNPCFNGIWSARGQVCEDLYVSPLRLKKPQNPKISRENMYL